MEENTNTSRRPFWLKIRQNIKAYSKRALIALLVIGIPVCVYALTPTAEEVLQDELVSIGRDWDKWDSIAKKAEKALTEAENAKLDLHSRAEKIRSLFQ